MRLSRLFSQTLYEAPAEAEAVSHRLLLRAGFIRPLAAGIFAYLPLAQRALGRIAAIMREEIEAIGGQEISMPVVQPAELWKQTGRWRQMGPELGRFQDRSGRDMALAMTHEEAAAALARSEVRSHRRLPALIYHIQTKWRDDPRPRAGLIRAREFTMLDSYSLDADDYGLEVQYRAHYQAYFNIFARCGLPVRAVGADVGVMGGLKAHEFMYLTPIGEDTLFFCDACGYAANRQIARFRKPIPPGEAPLPLEEVATPGAHTIEELAAFLGIPTERTAKAVFLVAAFDQGDQTREQLVFTVVRGDMEVNETKLAAAIGARDLRPAAVEEIRAIGAEPGYASPVGLQGVLVVVDDLIPYAPNLVAGANREGFHLRNVNYGRDYIAATVADIVAARDGDACPSCGNPMWSSRGVEVAKIFKLGTRYSESLGAYFEDESGARRPIVMGSYGIGLGRLLACVAEEHHDEKGLAWPVSVAPYPVHLIGLGSKSGEAESAAAAIYDRLKAVGIEPLYDDRLESAGVKFNDADLIGLPLRVTVGERGLKQGGVEVKRRTEEHSRLVPLDGLADALQAEVASMEAELASRVVEVPYRE
jgi:prolyl-tRNA synthetase